MTKLCARPLSPGLTVRVTGTPPNLAAATLARVDDIWQRELALSGKQLFNGWIFSVDSFDPAHVTGWFAEYRWLVAQRKEPDLVDVLNVNPLAVTGLCLCDDGVVFGRRAGHLDQDPGLWELVPSGGVDRSAADAGGNISLEAQFFTELGEELGVASAAVAGEPKPLVAVSDPESRVVEMTIGARIALSGGELIAGAAGLATSEHTDLEVVPIDDLGRFTEARGAALADVSRAILAAVSLSDIR